MVSVTPAGAPGNSYSFDGAVTPNGRFVAFSSNATDLVPGNSFGTRDLFVRDRRTGATAQVNVDSAGNEAGGDAWNPAISANGRFVVFESNSLFLVAGDTNGRYDAFLHDAKTGETTRVSTATDGTEGDDRSGVDGASMTANGRFVTFESLASNVVSGDTNGSYDVFVRDLKRGTLTRVSVDSDGNQGDGDSNSPSISANGRFVTFSSVATNLAPGDTNGAHDIFLHDLRTGTTTRVSVDSDGNQADSLSYFPVVTPSGKMVAFSSYATNLVAGDTNNRADVFVHDLRTGETRRASVDSAGQQGNGDSVNPALPSNGKSVVFSSDATNLVPGDANLREDVFLHDLRTGETRRLSVDAQGNEGDGDSYLTGMSLSPSGRFLVITSAASNFAAGDTNGNSDVFLLDLR